MITPKPDPPTRLAEKAAYEICTLRDMGRCVRCGTVGTVQRDHRQNRMRGNTVASNLQCLCPHCHQFKSEHPTQATEEGWSVPRWGVPSSWPAQRMVRGPNGLHLVWVLYDDLGGVRTIDEAKARRLMTGDGTVF